MKPSAKRVALNRLTLTRDAIEALKPGDKPWIAWDDQLTGFGVRVHPSGTKSFIVNYRAGDGGRKAPKQARPFWATMARYRPAGRGVWRGRVLDEAAADPAGGRPPCRACPCWSRPLRRTWQPILIGPSAPTSLTVTG